MKKMLYWILKRTRQILIIAVLLLPAVVSGQRNSDIGFMAAIPWYQGDISTIVPQANLVPPAIGPLLRYSFNKRSSIRGHAVFYTLSAEGEVFDAEPAQFQASFVDLGLDFEFNWWPYMTARRRTKYSPYVSAGLGYSVNYDGGSVSHLYLPFGGGFKANLGKRLSGGVEVSMRKNFTDLIDGIENVGSTEGGTPIGNNDWYLFTGVFLTYKIFDFGEPCPAME
ncbi:MAG: DUF6089 family protein [Bacteroidota bacterium]